MCKNSYYIKETASYFSDMLGESIDLKPARKSLQDTIPIAVSSNFDFYEGRLLGESVLLAYIPDGDSISPVQMKRQAEIVRRQTGLVVIVTTPKIASYNRARLVSQKVDLVVPGKLMFLPSLLIEIKRERTSRTDLKETMPPFAQCLLLYHLQVSPIAEATCHELSNKFAVSYGTVNVAVRWLAAKSLIRLDGTKTKTIQVDCGNRDLWNRALPMLVSPIEQVYYTDDVLEGQLISGTNALSVYTMINEDQNQCWALTKNEIKALPVERDKKFGQNEIQVWRYNPRILSTGEAVDKLSLYLSMKDNKDERIQMELERLIDEMQW